MRDEHERNLNALRAIMHICEEGAVDPLDDGSDGNEPWTKEDRARSKQSADWIRATFFTPKPLKQAPRERAHAARNEVFFTEAELWKALDHEDETIRATASAAMTALADLAALRSRRCASSFLVERRGVFHVRRLLDDMCSEESESSDAARKVFTTVMPLRAKLVAFEQPTTDDVRARAQKILEKTRERLEVIDRSANAGVKP